MSKKFKVGRPPKYETTEKDIKRFNLKMEEYFNSLIDDDGDFISPPTVNGLALFLGFADKFSLYEYQQKPLFTYSIKRARTVIEEYHESRMSGNSVAGSIFVLKNFAGWKETTETTVINKDYEIDLSDLDE